MKDVLWNEGKWGKDNYVRKSRETKRGRVRKRERQRESETNIKNYIEKHRTYCHSKPLS